MSEFETILDMDGVLEFDAMLAVWLGVNEAVVFEQINVAIQKNEGFTSHNGHPSVKLHLADFMNLFPFWDKNVIKRAIQNLKHDSLVIIPSSDWYSIDYDALERLDGPVERIKVKYAKRRKARDSRQLDHRPGYVYLCKKPDKKGLKIGSSLNVATRMMQLGTTLIASFPADDMADAELALHQRYNAKRLDGEYFGLNSEEKNFIFSIIEYAKGEFFTSED